MLPAKITYCQPSQPSLINLGWLVRTICSRHSQNRRMTLADYVRKRSLDEAAWMAN